MIKVSNIMGIEPKPFDPKTYVEEDVFVTDESGTKKRIRLEDNIVRWRRTRNSDGTTAVSVYCYLLVAFSHLHHKIKIFLLIDYFVWTVFLLFLIHSL